MSDSLLQPAVDAVGRGRRFLDATALRRRPEPGRETPSRVILETPAFRLRDFSRPGAAGRAAMRRDGRRHPLLIVPPEVNSSHVVDFGPGQSLVRAVLDAGFPRIASLDWRSAAGVAARRDVDDSLGSILDAVDALGGSAHLVGLCQGGWESAMVAALHPEQVRSLTLVAAPIDFHAGGGALRAVVEAMPMATYGALVAAGGGVMRGEMISAGFDNLLPLDRYLGKSLRIWRQLDDPVWMERFHRLEDWYRTPKDLPGPMYLRAVRELFKHNRLIEGRFIALGRPVDLANITAPLALVTGTRDHITPPAQTRAITRLANPSRLLDVEIDAGHIGTFMGR
ncbi:MAG: alpha/beta fold hydrolase, partial [Myxococcota bacterium]|nr:alpha/beta fold hydrolase [Myxococcota bacterium]